jgi:hypothetical protein
MVTHRAGVIRQPDYALSVMPVKSQMKYFFVERSHARRLQSPHVQTYLVERAKAGWRCVVRLLFFPIARSHAGRLQSARVITQPWKG